MAMADRAAIRELLSRDRINIRQPREVELWTEALDIYTADLVAAITEVGDSSAAVLTYLRENGIPGSRSRTPPPQPKPSSQ
jgi:uncharacterized protein DUF3606